METFIGIIPARYASSRFPGKPLCDIFGKPMIWHTYMSALKWDHWKSIYVATDSKEIAESCKAHDIPCVMTSDSCTDCLDRTAEVAALFKGTDRAADKYITIQGDEPLFNVQTLNVDLSPPVVNFYTEVHDQDEKYDPNAVKVVVSYRSRALYFSRLSLPYDDEKTRRTDEPCTIYKQIGVYSFDEESLLKYANLSPSSLENLEGIGLNRLLQNDIDVFMRYTPFDSISVDTPEDRDRILSMIEENYSDRGLDICIDGTVTKHPTKHLP